MNIRQQTNAFFVFHEQTFLNDLRHVCAGQLHAVAKPCLNLGKVIALLVVHLANNRSHLFLGGHDYPCPTPALGGQALGNGLQVGHEFDISGNVLTNFIDEEVQTEIGRLTLNKAIDLFGKIFDGDPVLAAVLVEYP